MVVYLTFAGRGAECAGCGNEIRHGLVGWSDEITGRELQPFCRSCVAGLDPKLRAVQEIVTEAGQRMLEDMQP